MNRRIGQKPCRSIKMPAPYEPDDKLKNVEIACDFLGIGGNNRTRIARILIELQENSNLYTDRGHIKHSSIELKRESDKIIDIEARGVMNRSQQKSLAARIDLISKCNREELEELLGRCVADAFMKGRRNIEICGPDEVSKGSGMGLILIALCANGGISIKENTAPGVGIEPTEAITS